MWTDAARTASMDVRGGASGGNVAAQGAAIQRGFVGANRGPVRSQARGGAVRGRGAPGSVVGITGHGPVGQPAPAAHATGVGQVARNMYTGGQQDTSPDRPGIARMNQGGQTNPAATDRNTNVRDNLAARYSAGSMVGDHTRAVELQRYLD